VLVDNNLMGIPVLKSVAEARRPTMYKVLAPDEKQVWFDSINYSRDVPFTTNWLDMVSAYVARTNRLASNTTTPDEAARAITQDINRLLIRSK
jgi:multiple sugar transport system substrate-binding protein